jgi:type I restriction-modification system DNA methylase subunit
MSDSTEQAFLEDLDKKLWNAADRLRSNLDAAVYKHAVLGLIFLKYVSDAFDLRREELEASFRDPKSDYFLDRADYQTDAANAEAIHDELEDCDYFTEKNVFWVPPLAEQTRIVAEVERRLSVVDELESVIKANLQRATRLRQSILQQAFAGALI